MHKLNPLGNSLQWFKNTSCFGLIHHYTCSGIIKERCECGIVTPQKSSWLTRKRVCLEADEDHCRRPDSKGPSEIRNPDIYLAFVGDGVSLGEGAMAYNLPWTKRCEIKRFFCGVGQSPGNTEEVHNEGVNMLPSVHGGAKRVAKETC